MFEESTNRPFYRRIDIVASLSNGSQQVDGLRVKIEYPEHKPGKITASVLGIAEDSTRLEKLYAMDDSTLTMQGLSAQFPNDETFQVKSSSVEIMEVSSFTGSKSAHHTVALLLLGDLEIQYMVWDREKATADTDSTSDEKRFLSFFLAGPESVWGMHWIDGDSYTGNRQIEVMDSLVELSGDRPFEVHCVPWFFYDKLDAEGNSRVETNVIALRFSTSKSIVEYSGQEFMQEGRLMATDLTQAASLMARQWIVWYSYRLRFQDRVTCFYRRTRPPGVFPYDPSVALVGPRHARSFLDRLVCGLRDAKEKGVDLNLPLSQFVDGSNKANPEEMFTTLFLSLEKLKDLHAARNGLQYNSDKASFRDLSKKLKEVIRCHYDDPDTCERVSEKLIDLNRTSIRFVCEDMFNQLKVDWTDLYPPDTEIRIFNTRNKLFHTGKSVEDEYLLKECHRLYGLVARVLCRILGWNDRIYCPTERDKRWLQSE